MLSVIGGSIPWNAFDLIIPELQLKFEREVLANYEAHNYISTFDLAILMEDAYMLPCMDEDFQLHMETLRPLHMYEYEQEEDMMKETYRPTLQDDIALVLHHHQYFYGDPFEDSPNYFVHIPIKTIW